MGTRAQFFIGNPQDIEGREWLGTVAFDGYPDGDCDRLAGAKTEGEFSALVSSLAAERRDFCDPAKHGYPFPWINNLFLTDCTYAFFDGKVMFTYFHRRFVELSEYLAYTDDQRQKYGDGDDELPSNVPAPALRDLTAPDSIISIALP